jgi:starvation-inducible DNA-binding protein
MANTNIGLTESQILQVSEILKGLLADEIVLQTKTRNFHWNVTGMHFSELHIFFEGQYGELDTIIDDTAERIRQLGKTTPGSLSEFLKLTRLKESGGDLKEKEMLGALLSDHESIIRQLRTDIETADQAGDAGNADFLTGLLASHEKMAWMIRSYLS